MKHIKTDKIQIVSGLIWATVIIACSYFVRGTRNSEIIYNILFVGAVMHFLLLSELKSKITKHTKTPTKPIDSVK